MTKFLGARALAAPPWALLLWAALLTVQASPLRAQQAPDPIAFAKTFLDALMSKSLEEAYKVIGEDTYLARVNKASTITLREASQKAIFAYGTLTSYEMVRDQKLGSTYRNLVFLVNHRQLGVVYTMTFYRTPQGWNLVRMELQDSASRMTFE